QFLAGLYDPRSPVYHHFIDAKTFGQRFGVPAQALRAVAQQLSAQGVEITAQYPQRTAIDARAAAGVVERLFDTRLLDYVTAGGRRFHEPATTPLVPKALAGVVTGVAGLDGRYQVMPADVPSGGLRPGNVGPVYDLTPL